MVEKKSVFTDCENCPLLSQGMVIGESNSTSDLKKVRVLFLAEAPAKNEVIKKTPLIGKAGNIFREPFVELKLNKIPHYITNVCLCSNLDETGKTSNPPAEALELCKPNWQNLIKVLEPELIVAMGTTVVTTMGLDVGKDFKITQGRGNIYKYENYNVLVTFHPSYVARNGSSTSSVGQLFVSDLKEAYNFLNPGEIDVDLGEAVTVVEPYKYELPEWVLDDKHVLIDVQRMPLKGKIVYIMRNINGEKKYFECPDNKYYFYVKNESMLVSPMIEKAENVSLIFAKKPTEKIPGKTMYESDLKIEMKHTIDYYLQKKNEPVLPLNILYFDIEVFSDENKEFPHPLQAPSPINAISFQNNDDKIHVYLSRLKKMSNEKILEKENCVIKIFDNEKALITAFCNEIKKLHVDIITGWNSNGFDIPYIYTRMNKLSMNSHNLSPLGYVNIDIPRNHIQITGLYSLDMYLLYKDYSAGGEESNKLGAISRKILGEDKVEYEGTLDKLYMEDINKFIDYSFQDTSLLRQLDKKLGHIDLRNELRKICSTTWKAAESTMGQIDPLCISYAKKMNLVCKNAEMEQITDKLPGAYVREPKVGLYNWIVDFDFTSLYPSVIISTNCGPNTYIGKVDAKFAEKFIYKKDKIKEGTAVDITFDPMNRENQTTKITIEEFNNFIKENSGIVTIAGTIFKGQDKEVSFFNKILAYLLDSRVEYKDEMKKAKRENVDHKIYHNIQLAYKILANSIYGVLANHAFRMCKLDLAKTVTLTGQEILKFSMHHLDRYMQSDNLEIDKNFMAVDFDNVVKSRICYGDTDSVFLAIGDYLEDKKII